jgi:spermidine synthase
VQRGVEVPLSCFKHQYTCFCLDKTCLRGYSVSRHLWCLTTIGIALSDAEVTQIDPHRDLDRGCHRGRLCVTIQIGQEQISVSKKADRLLVVGGLTNDRHTVFKFSEPAGTSPDVLFSGLKDGSYTKAFLIEEFEYRSLCFALDGCTQSEMHLNDPYALVNEYTRKMMGFLAFQPHPERVLVIGLGGGSLVKYCHRHLPSTQITAIEIDPDVLALRSQFFVPPDDERLRIIQADGADHIAQMVDRGERTSAILVDAYDHKGIAKAVVEKSFLENAKRCLGTHGVFVMNLVAEGADAIRHIASIRQVFGESVIVIAIRRGGSNLVVFAGQTLYDPQRVRLAARNAKRIEDRLGLFFPTLIQHLNEIADPWINGAHHVLK